MRSERAFLSFSLSRSFSLLSSFQLALGMVSLVPRTLQGIPSNSLGDSYIGGASVCKSWRRRADRLKTQVANLEWSGCPGV